MKPVKHTSKVPTKGARKKWPLLREVQQVVLTPQMLQGQIVRMSTTNNGNKSHFLVP